MRVAVIGGGAAGFFAAIQLKLNFPKAEVQILEKSDKLLEKVRISGGGRCNVTNACPSVAQLAKSYPRGGKMLKKLFQEFNNQHTIQWFEERGVELHTEADGRMFPVSNNSETIVNCLMDQCKLLGVSIHTQADVSRIEPQNGAFRLQFRRDKRPPAKYDKLIIATGGAPRKKALEWLLELGHELVDPVPSLFTFNMPGDPVHKLMGVSVERAVVKVLGTKLEAEGPLLITHWGMSGPAILKLSAFGARMLHERKHEFELQVNWMSEPNQSKVMAMLESLAEEHPKKQLQNLKPLEMPNRLWEFLLNKAELSPKKSWRDLGKKGNNKLVNVLCNDIYPVSGKTTFKEEFVTAGGLSLESINPRTMESKICKGMYFTGEVLDIDGITGGFNFQAAWTTAYFAARLR